MYSESQKKATAKYMKNNLDDIKIRVKKGDREKYKEFATANQMSLNTLFITAVDTYISQNEHSSKFNSYTEEK